MWDNSEMWAECLKGRRQDWGSLKTPSPQWGQWPHLLCTQAQKSPTVPAVDSSFWCRRARFVFFAGKRLLGFFCSCSPLAPQILKPKHLFYVQWNKPATAPAAYLEYGWLWFKPHLGLQNIHNCLFRFSCTCFPFCASKSTAAGLRNIFWSSELFYFCDTMGDVNVTHPTCWWLCVWLLATFINCNKG